MRHFISFCLGLVGVTGLAPSSAAVAQPAAAPPPTTTPGSQPAIGAVRSASQYVTILGAFRSPGLIPINRPYRLSEILERVGGVHDFAADYLIIRSENGQEKRYSVDAVIGGSDEEDPFVNPGSRIFAPQGEMFSVDGQVREPGAYPLKSNLSIRLAIARAGGSANAGSDHPVQVLRDGKVLSLDPSAKVQAGDVLTVLTGKP